jgi:hypothetical protein
VPTSPTLSVTPITGSRASKPRTVFPRNPERPPWREGVVREWEEAVACGKRDTHADRLDKPPMWMMIYDHWNVTIQRECLHRLLRQRGDIRFLVERLTAMKAGGGLRTSHRAKLREALSAIRPLERQHDKMLNVARRLFRARLLCPVPMLEAKIDDNADVHHRICGIAYRAFKAFDTDSVRTFDACFRPRKHR